MKALKKFIQGRRMANFKKSVHRGGHIEQQKEPNIVERFKAAQSLHREDHPDSELLLVPNFGILHMPRETDENKEYFDNLRKLGAIGL